MRHRSLDRSELLPYSAPAAIRREDRAGSKSPRTTFHSAGSSGVTTDTGREQGWEATVSTVPRRGTKPIPISQVSGYVVAT